METGYPDEDQQHRQSGGAYPGLFADCDKRAAVVVSTLFLAMNGREVTASDEESIPTFVALAAGDLLEYSLTDCFSANSREVAA